jgi:hypothetical protein
VYLANSRDELRDKVAAKDAAWCGLEAVLDGKACGLQASPFNYALLGVKGPPGRVSGAGMCLE